MLGDEELWIAAGGALLLLLVTLQMRRYRRKLKAKRRDGSEAEREQAGS
jgi:positive regulator of sigma E activity